MVRCLSSSTYVGIFWIIPAAANIWLAWRRPASNSSQCFLPVTSFETPCCLFPLFRLFVASFFFVDSSLPLSSFQTFTNLLYNPHQPSLTSPSPSISPSALYPHYISTLAPDLGFELVCFLRLSQGWMCPTTFCDSFLSALCPPLQTTTPPLSKCFLNGSWLWVKTQCVQLFFDSDLYHLSDSCTCKVYLC